MVVFVIWFQSQEQERTLWEMVRNVRQLYTEPWMLLGVALIVVLFVKFFWSYFAFSVPLGYDPGIYRYLFVTHAQGFPPFLIADLEPWAQAHPLGLFIFTTVFLKLGLPVDWLLGWIWNLIPVVLLLTLAWVSAKKWGKPVGVLVLLMGILSMPYYDGFAAMYYKTYAALLFVVLTFHFLDRRSFLALIPAGLALITHHQTGLVLLLAFVAWWAQIGVRLWRDPQWYLVTAVAATLGVLVGLFYLPIWYDAVWPHLITLFTTWGSSAPAGSFPPARYYLRYEFFVLLLGVIGFFWTLNQKKELTLWHWAALFSALFVIGQLFFYRRFFLHLDFFLLPFGAYALFSFTQHRNVALRVMIVLALLGQVAFSLHGTLRWAPQIDPTVVASMSAMAAEIPQDSSVIALENNAAPVALGWLPHHKTGGPGLFGRPYFSYRGWERFLYGSHDDRRTLLSHPHLSPPLYFLTSPLFHQHYGEYVKGFLADPCFKHVDDLPLLEVTCPVGQGTMEDIDTAWLQ